MDVAEGVERRRAIGPAPVQLVNSAEIGRRLNVSRERVRQWTANPNLRFPEPAGQRGRSRTWDWAVVAEWAERHSTARSVIAYAERRRAGELASAGPRSGRQAGHRP